MEIKTKSRGGCCRLRLIGADGDASQKTSFPSCRHRHHQCHALHDDNSHHGSKSGRRPFKKSAFSGEKIAAWGSPSLTLPKGRECQPDVVHILDVWGGWSMSLVVFRTCIDALYTLLYMCLSAWVGESMVCPCKVQVVKDIVEDILLWGLSCLGMSGS